MSRHAAATLDLEEVERYLAARLPDFKGPLTAEKTAIGQSNPTFVLRAASGSYVLRRKPPGKLLKSAHAVDREYRVMTALRTVGADVPVPRTLHLCEDESVIGSVFFVMDYVPGRTIMDPALPDVSPADRAAIYDDMNRCLASLHKIDVAGAGLSDFGPPGNYFERQTHRWSRQYRASQTEEISEMDRLISWLEGSVPEDDGQVGLVHGDWRIDNLRIASDRPLVVAVLDWELSTIGHPLADLGYQLMQWRMPAGEIGRGLEFVDRTALGLPSDEEYIRSYAARRGLTALPDLTFPIVFAFFRIAAILQGVKKRAIDGNASNPEAALRMGSYVAEFARRGLAAIEGG